MTAAADLLARYAATRDAEAFATLVGDYQSMVLATCRRRVRAPGDVDDAVQETFLKLAKNAATLRTNVAAWLHRCAVNVSADINRRREARLRHEQASAEVRADEDAQRELAELREHLDAALEKLDEPTRELILQRFFVGRSQVEIAKEAGVSPSAISQRLDRAIAQLRGHLAGSGAVVAGGAGLAALLSAEQASAVVAPTLMASLNAIGLAGVAPAAEVGAGVAAGTWAALAASIAVACAAVGATLWFRAQAAPPAAAVVAPAAIASAVAAPAPAVGGLLVRSDDTGVTTPASPAWSAPAAPAAGVLSGRITDADGKPIAGASVVLPNVTSGPVKTDADGRYSFASVPSNGEYRLAVTAPGYAPVWGDFGDREVPIRLAAGAQAQRDVILRRAVRATVVIDAADGGALENLRVSYLPIVAGDAEARVSERVVGITADGVATLPLPVGETPYAIVVTAKDRAPQFVTVTPKDADAPMNVPITLDRGVPLIGTAICSDGKPGVGWAIAVRPVDWPSRNPPYEPATIDADGRFTVPHAVPGTYEVSYRVPMGELGRWAGRSLGRFTLTADAPVALSIPMKSPGALAKIAGKVRWVGDVEHTPYVSVDARSLTDANRWHSSSLRYDPRTGRDATFSIANVEPDEYEIRFEGPTLAPVKLSRVKIPGELPPIELRVARQSQLAGVVTDAQTGKPVANFAFRLRKLATVGDGPNYVPSRDWTQVGDRDGTFVTDVPGPGEYQAHVSAPGYAWTWGPSVRIESLGATATVEVKLSRGGTVRGVVRDREGKPVAGAKVIPFSMAQSPVVEHGGVSKRFLGEAGAVVTDAEGKYELKHLAAGVETLKIVHADFAPTQLNDVAVTENGLTDAPPATLGAGATVAGVVYDADGRPAANVAVQFQDRGAYNGDEEAGRVAQAVTDADGKYRVAGLPDGVMLYANLADRWRRGGVVRRLVRATSDRPVTLDFGGANVVAGRLLNRDGTPRTGDVVVTLSSGDRNFGGVMASAKPDADGRFAIRGVPGGRYLLYADRPQDDGRVPVRDVAVGDAPLDLGDLVDPRGRVALALAAEDPADVAAIARVQIWSDPKGVGWELPVGQFRKDGDRWVCNAAPAGRFVARLFDTANQLAGQIVIERQPGDAEQTVAFTLPKRSATLRYVPSTPATKAYSRLVDEGGATWFVVGGDKERSVVVSPGTYRFAGPTDARPRADVPSVVAKAGETTDVAAPAAAPQASVAVYVWSADGQLRSDATVTLIDAAGRPVAPLPWLGHERAVFGAGVGKYTARVTVPGKPGIERPIEVPAAFDPAEGVVGHVMMPE